jgi:hypothetical protein
VDEHTQKLKDYIRSQLHSGISPDEISKQLVANGWKEDAVQAGFYAVQAEVLPSGMAQPSADVLNAAHSVTPQANGQRRGRIRTGWQLFKQSWAVLRGNPGLLRYLYMTAIWVTATTAVFLAIYVIGSNVIYADADGETWMSYGLGFLNYVMIFFYVNLYAAGLTANVFDIFQGKKQPYSTYMAMARAKVGPIFLYSVISAIVGFLLEYVVERIRFVGWLLRLVLGAAWSLATMFTVPIIMSEERPNGITEIGKSFRFFKQTWGESITAKVTVNGPLFIIQLALGFVFFVGMWPMLFSGSTFLVWLWVILYLIAAITMFVIGAFANSLVNIALFFYASRHEVPPAFSQDLLDQVFVKKKLRGGFAGN